MNPNPEPAADFNFGEAVAELKSLGWGDAEVGEMTFRQVRPTLQAALSEARRGVPPPPVFEAWDFGEAVRVATAHVASVSVVHETQETPQ